MILVFGGQNNYDELGNCQTLMDLHVIDVRTMCLIVLGALGPLVLNK